jgi:hypothetical protein
MNYRYLTHVTAWLTMAVCLFGMVILAGAGIAQRIEPVPGLAALALLFVVGYLAGRLADATEDF